MNWAIWEKLVKSGEIQANGCQGEREDEASRITKFNFEDSEQVLITLPNTHLVNTLVLEEVSQGTCLATPWATLQ